MDADGKIIEIIEDHALLCAILCSIAHSLKTGAPLPNHLPCLNDGVMTDILSSICERLKRLRNEA